MISFYSLSFPLKQLIDGKNQEKASKKEEMRLAEI